MLHKDYDGKGSIKKKSLVVSFKGFWREDELIGGKPTAVK
jgi:hypothetical protein